MSANAESFADDMAFLARMAADVLEASRVAPGRAVLDQGPNTTGRTLIRPGGGECYPAFWIRDFTMSLECGLVTVPEIGHAVRLTAGTQCPAEWFPPSGSRVPRGAIADHVTFAGQPVYFPGTYDYDKQGRPFGHLPSLDDHFYFVEMARHLVQATGDPAILGEPIGGIPLLARLELAFAVPPAAPDGTELAWCTEEERGVGFGFCDSIVHTGHLLFCSVLRARAARQMAEMMELCGDREGAAKYRAIARTIADHLVPVFLGDDGFLRASTGRSAQPDVWGSAFAVYSGLVDGVDRMRVCRALGDAHREGTIAWKGNIRHVPADRDFSGTSAWEATVSDAYVKNRYQNGAYWNTPTGWVCYAVAQVDPGAARQLARDFVAELREGDFRKGQGFGSPYECIHPDGDYRQNAIYLTSVTCPLAAFRKLGWVETPLAKPASGGTA